MHPAEILIQLYEAQEAGANAPFSAQCSGEFSGQSCSECPAVDACDFITNLRDSPAESWEATFKSYCSSELNKSFDQLKTEYPEFLI